MSAVTLLCSPRPGGVSDTAARIFAEGAAEAGVGMRPVALRDYSIQPCTGCRKCAPPPHSCRIAASTACRPDQTEEIFALLRSSPLVFIAAPVYFYALPSHFKALIDRSQRFWAAREQSPQQRQNAVVVALTAGRKRGRRLFSGSLLTLGYFLRALGAELRQTRLLRGLEDPKDLLRRRRACACLRDLGRNWGQRAAGVRENA